MGADGGVQWCAISDPKEWERLTSHIYFPSDYKHSSGYREPGDIIAELLPSDAVCSESSMYDHATLMGLRDLAEEASEPYPADPRFTVQEPWIGDFDWRTLVTTSPTTLSGHRLVCAGILDGLRTGVAVYDSWDDEKRMDRALKLDGKKYPALDMMLRDWAPQLLAIMGSVQYEETWT